ncbi:expressed unknown protein [Seminavis robusta]|uniref:Uncharacterized protein n=1 Tax=Seminavis robusta TaxID=568900 RepID=A0A9N8DZG3_9STRA|nr:expressed unknown protein [Seminavis robusta]|eukprot:Sro412_g137980.1 n/a (576) ;mRNA; r:60696-62423
MGAENGKKLAPVSGADEDDSSSSSDEGPCLRYIDFAPLPQANWPTMFPYEVDINSEEKGSARPARLPLNVSVGSSALWRTQKRDSMLGDCADSCSDESGDSNNDSCSDDFNESMSTFSQESEVKHIRTKRAHTHRAEVSRTNHHAKRSQQRSQQEKLKRSTKPSKKGPLHNSDSRPRKTRHDVNHRLGSSASSLPVTRQQSQIQNHMARRGSTPCISGRSSPPPGSLDITRQSQQRVPGQRVQRGGRAADQKVGARKKEPGARNKEARARNKESRGRRELQNGRYLQRRPSRRASLSALESKNDAKESTEAIVVSEPPSNQASTVGPKSPKGMSAQRDRHTGKGKAPQSNPAKKQHGWTPSLSFLEAQRRYPKQASHESVITAPTVDSTLPSITTEHCSRQIIEVATSTQVSQDEPHSLTKAAQQAASASVAALLAAQPHLDSLSSASTISTTTTSTHGQGDNSTAALAAALSAAATAAASAAAALSSLPLQGQGISLSSFSLQGQGEGSTSSSIVQELERNALIEKLTWENAALTKENQRLKRLLSKATPSSATPQTTSRVDTWDQFSEDVWNQ